jgi:hypothetical protein
MIDKAGDNCREPLYQYPLNIHHSQRGTVHIPCFPHGIALGFSRGVSRIGVGPSNVSLPTQG